jgi:hypothetical protein
MKELRELCDAVERAVPRWPEGLAERTERFRSLAASDALAARIAEELEALAARPTYTPSVTASLHSWVLWVGPRGAKLMVVRIPAGEGDDAAYLTDSPADQLVAGCGPEPLDGVLYEQCAAVDPEVMTPGLALTPRGAVTLRRGEVLALRPRRDVLDLLPCPEPRYLLLLDGPRLLRQQWVYAREGLAAIATVAADPHDARLEAGMRLLRVLGHTPALPVLARLATHEAHFVRWTAIRYATALDVAEGRRLLAAAAADPHPHVRAAAQRALARG